MRKTSVCTVTGMLAACCLLAAWTGQAQTYTFTNDAPAGASWFDAGNWDSNAVPTASIAARINRPGGNAYCIIDDTNAVASSVSIGHINALSQHLHVKPGADLTANAVYLAYGNGEGVLTVEGDITIPYPNRLYVPNWGAGNPVGTVTQLAGKVEMGVFYGANYANTTGRYMLQGGVLKPTLAYWGDQGDAYFSQYGGTNLTGWYFYLGYRAGGLGVYTQYGGVASMGYYGMRMGWNAGSTGVYHLVDGNFAATTSGTAPLIGNQGWAWFRQSGGTSDFDHIIIGSAAGGVGTCTIEGGVFGNPSMLRVGSAAGTGTFEVVGSAATIDAQSYTQAPGSTLSFVVTNGIAPIRVGGTAYFNGTLNIATRGPRPINIVTAMTYTTYSGTFSSITYDTDGYHVPVFYESDSLKLDFRPKGTIMLVQ